MLYQLSYPAAVQRDGSVPAVQKSVTNLSLDVDPARVIADLRSLDALTGGPAGARRIAWTPTWAQAREFVKNLCREIGVEAQPDAAANLWWTLPGTTESAADHGRRERRRGLIVGSHVDSVPSGGWLDGALGVLAGVELLRAARRSDAPLPAISLVDWADEEGARFGVSLFGSSLALEELDGAPLGDLRDADGVSLRSAVEPYGVLLEEPIERPRALHDAAAYLELHIEQGPVLEAADRPIAAVSGTVGIERDMFVIVGQASHAGTTPMDQRRDALLVGAELALGVERVAREHEGVGTVGRIDLTPGVATAIAGQAAAWVDLRHTEPGPLAGMREAVLELAQQAARDRGCRVNRESLFSIEPRAFDHQLVQEAISACAARGGADYAIPSGALHDAAVVSATTPTVMLFCASKRGLSHCAEEDSSDADIELAVRALADVASRVLS